MNKISTRQLYFFLACVAPVGKLVILPARLSEYVGNDLLIPAALHYLLQSAAVFCVLLLFQRGKSIYDLLKDAFGKIGAGVVVLFLSVFLCFCAILPLLEQKIFVQGTFYDTIPSLLAFSPFFLVSVYLCSKPLVSSGRVWDIIGPLSIAGYVGVMIFSMLSTDLGAILPIAGSGPFKILRGIAYTFSWFYDAAILLMFLGKVDYQKGMALKGALFYALGGVFVLLFLATFYGIFEETAVNQLFAFTNTSKYFSGITVLGRVDFIFIYALSLVMIFYCTLPLHAAVEGALQVFGRKKYLPTILSLIVNAVMVGLTIYFDYRFSIAMTIFSQKGFWVYAIFALAVPPLFLLIRRRRHERK